jgi:hypothetical protein
LTGRGIIGFFKKFGVFFPFLFCFGFFRDTDLTFEGFGGFCLGGEDFSGGFLIKILLGGDLSRTVIGTCIDEIIFLPVIFPSLVLTLPSANT